MSGHSKWAKIKRQKGVNDSKRGNLFTKLAKNITLASKEGGPDPAMNFTLRLAIDKAKAANMPSDNIKRAIEKGSGKGTQQSAFQRVSYEALGPGGVALIIDCQTDNTNRTVSEIRNIIETAGGKFSSTGSVSWKFVEKGLIIISLKKIVLSEKFGKGDEKVEISAEDAGMEIMEISGIEDLSDITWEVNEQSVPAIELIMNKEDFGNILKRLEELNYEILSAELVKLPKERVVLNDEQLNRKIVNFVETLEEHDDIDSVWVNL